MHGTKFYRPARAYPPLLPTDEFIINAPPQQQAAQGGAIQWLQYLLPLVGVLGSLVYILAFHEGIVISIAVAGIGLCTASVGIVMGIAQRRVQKKQRQAEHAGYVQYLTSCRTRLHMLAQQQRALNERLYPPAARMLADVLAREHLWERRLDDRDFLEVRVGLGPMPLCCRVRLDLGNKLLTSYVPDLCTNAESLVNEYQHLDDLPAVIALRFIGTLAVNGERALVQALVRTILCQIVTYHSPEDVRCMAYFPRQAAQDWSWLRWLPHVRRLRQIKAEKQRAPDPLCLLADTVEGCQDLLINQIKPELDRRRRIKGDKRAVEEIVLKPHLVIILDGFSPQGPLAQLAELDEIFRDAATLGVTIICLADERSQEPSIVQTRLALSSANWLDLEEIKFGGRRLEGIIPDGTELATCEQLARCLTPLTLGDTGVQQDLAQDVRLLDLLDVHAADLLQVTTSWQPRSRCDLLRVPIGLRGDGEVQYLDIKEAAEKGMGPHGLVVGATGSGKSELLRTIVTSLAVTHDPSMVNFVLVDFKGGASFADFAALPHVAGIITNLQGDLTLVDRAYASLLGEQQRRQRMLHDAGNLDNIKQYQAKWQMYPEMEPMPHLLIIADEFAELIANRPDFLELFITMGRVGRSLGLHLLLATQRIDEGRIRGLEGHLRYRICLRTFSASESSSVLGTPDAYYLPSAPGVGYFKVDTDTYNIFKTALISIPFVPSHESRSLLSVIRELTPTGTLVYPLLPLEQQETTVLSEAEPSELHTEMDVVISQLLATQLPTSDYRVHQVWLPPLSTRLPLGAVLERCQRGELDGSRWETPPVFGSLRVPVGLLDKPLEQAQEPLMLNFAGSGGHLALVGAPQSGKSTFLRTLVTSFIVTHAPHDVQFYCIDLGGGLLRIFEPAPHVGAICGKSERDKIRRLIAQMRKIIEEREFLLS